MLYRKMLRDLKGNITQFISIFLMTFMGILIFTGLNAVGEGMEYSSNQYYEETNLSDAFLYGENFTKEEALGLEDEEFISKVERRLQLDATVKNQSSATLQLNFVESNSLSSNHLVEGEAFDSKEKGIWLDYSYATANSLSIGDSISVVIQGQTLTESIRGLILNPEYVYWVKDETAALPDYKNCGYGFLSASQWTFSPTVPYNQLLLETTAEKVKLDSILSKRFSAKQTVLVMQKDQSSVGMFHNEIQQMQAMQAVFPIVFLLIAILTTLTTMTRITTKQRLQIGSLKSFGFSNRRILWHYASFGVIIGTTGGVLGTVLGPILLPKLIFRFQKTMYALPHWEGHMAPWVVSLVLICILGCGMSGYLACKKELVGTAAQILRPKAPKLGKHTGFEKGSWWNSRSFDLQWNIRDLLRNPLRSSITILGIVGCMALILCAFGMKDTVGSLMTTSYEKLNTYDTKITLSSNITPNDLSSLRADEEYQFIQESPIELNYNTEIITSMLSVLSKGEYIKTENTSGNFVTLPSSGIAITNKLAQQYNLENGDTLSYRIYGTKDWTNVQIKEILHSPMGQGIFVSETAYESLHQVMTPTAFVSQKAASTFTAEEFDSVQSKEDLVQSIDTLMETLNVMIGVLVFSASLLGIVVLYNLGVLSFHERLRELTTLKVLGFSYRKLYKLLQMQNIWLTIAGVFLGLPAGYLLLAYMMQFMGDNFDMFPFISPVSYGISIMGTLSLSLLVNWILSRKLKTIDMVSALKSVE